MTTPPHDPASSPNDASSGSPYGQPGADPYGPGNGYEGATNGFGQPFVPLSKEPDDLQRAAAQRAAQQAAQQAQGQGPFGQPGPYGQTPQYGQQSPYGSPPPFGAPNPYGPPSPYGPQPGGYPPYFPPTPPRNGLATASLVLGIISVVLFAFSFFDLPIAIVGLILGIVGLKRSRVLHGHGRAFAIWGISLSAVGLLLAGIMSIYLIGRIQDCSDYDIGTTAWETCVVPE